MTNTTYEPPASLHPEAQAAYRRFHRVTGLIPAKVRDVVGTTRAFEVLAEAPATLTDEDLAKMATVFTEEAIAAFHAREKAKAPVPPAPSTPTSRRREAARAPHQRTKAVTPEEADALLSTALANAGPVEYDYHAAIQAAYRCFVAFATGDKTTELDDRDVAQLHILSRQLALNACMLRAGHDPDAPVDKSDRSWRNEPMTLDLFYRWCGNLFQADLLAMRHEMRQIVARVTTIEQQAPARTDAGGNDGLRDLDDLHRRVSAMEARPALEYRGVWREGDVYPAGSAVSWGGSMWIAREHTTAKPGTADVASRAWTLAVKKGADGRSWKSTERGIE